MAVLSEKRCHALKYVADPLFLVCLTNKNAAYGGVVGNRLVLAPAGKE